MPLRIFAEKFRGFRSIDIDLSGSCFLVGDNSSGKTSILLLTEYVMDTELSGIARLNREISSPYDFFSPFFDNDDVLIGFENSDDHGTAYKLVTLAKRAGMSPIISTCTFASASFAITLRSSGDGPPLAKFAKGNFSRADIIRLHKDSPGFQETGMRRGADITTSVVAHLAGQKLAPDAIDEEGFNKAIFVGIEGSARHLGPLRGLPERYYRFERRYQTTGGHFAAMWKDMPLNSETKRYRELVDKFGQEAGLFDHLEVETIAPDLEDSPLLVTVSRKGHRFLIGQVGIGVSQVIPVLIEAVFSAITRNRDWLLVQQPELHLHPRAQAALGDFLFSLSSGGTRFLAESHSDFLIDRYRAKVRESGEASPATLIFCHSSEGWNEMEVIEIDSAGALSGASDAYYEFFISEYSRTIF